ncbi:MFS transporter [Brevibacterium aurantiacum]|uniref:Major facilitator superfamily (MFS) profile domain-containing protein n=1 Tax=Brevibacterium aurantiacum TaxID=273384 RepID=A0A2A3ZU80_BREAU|nr:MFS transporter [Brevibacterium aurantiacum]PCC55104.1 hypothetical protein CIK59_02775 [Brevibacterium aurantiacum]
MAVNEDIPEQQSIRISPGLVSWKYRGLLMAVTLALLQLMNEVGALMAIPFYGSMAADLDFAPAQASWAVAATLLAGGASVPVMSKIGDLHGHRRVLIICLVLIVAGFTLSAVATNFVVLVTGRALVGVVAGQALTIGILNDRLSAADRGKAIGLVAAFQAVGIPLGLGLGGVLIDVGASWRTGFWIGAALTALGLIATLLWVSESDARIRSRAKSQTVNYGGVVLMGIGLTSLCIGVNESTTWGMLSGGTIAFVIGGLVLICASFYWESRSRHPLLNVRKAFSARLLPAYAVFVQTGIIGFILFSTVLGWAQTDPALLGYGFGISLVLASMLFLPYVFAGLVAPRLIVPALLRFPAKWVQLSAAVACTVGVVIIYFGYADIPTLVIGILVYAFGFTSLVAAAVNVIAAEASEEQGAGTASVYVAVALFASALGTVLFSAAIAAGHAPDAPPTPANYEAALLIAVFSTLIGIVGSLLLSPDVRIGHRIKSPERQS